MSLNGDFFEEYFEYIGTNEAPLIYNRWAAISMIGALLCRQYKFPFGHGYIYPNQYIMLIGPPGFKKGTAMRPARTLLELAGYNHFGPNRTSPERFAIDLQKSISIDGDYEDLKDIETINLNEDSQLFVFAEEFADFIGIKNMNFINMLTNLWDNLPKYEHPKIHGKSIVVIKPTVNILAGTTPQSLIDAIPPESIGQGFTSRYIFVGAPNAREKITWPTGIVESAQNKLVDKILYIQKNIKGDAKLTNEAKETLDTIYKKFKGVDDHRFMHYSSRRFPHLLKICLIMSAMRGSTTINYQDAIRANTILAAAEKLMPRALGELGRSRFSEVSNNILNMCHTEMLTFRDLWRRVSHDLDKEADLNLILRNLMNAGKLQVISVRNKQVFKRNIEPQEDWDSKLIDVDFLTKEESI